MARLILLASHVLPLLAWNLADTSGHCSGSDTCTADELELQDGYHQRKGSSLVQKQAVKMRVEPGGAAASLVAVAVALNGSADSAVLNSSSVSGNATPVTLADGLAQVGPLIEAHAVEQPAQALKISGAGVPVDNLAERTLGQPAAPVITDGETNTSNILNLTVEGQALSSQAAAPSSESIIHKDLKATPSEAEEKEKAAVMPAEEKEKAGPSGASEEKESAHSFADDVTGGIHDMGQLLRGRPQVLSIFMMMLLPAGICTVMYCVFHIIHSMDEDQSPGRDEAASGSAPGERERVLTLGEVMQPSASPQRSYEPLCPELLAPGDNECLIGLPSLNDVSSSSSSCERLLASKTGSPIVRISLTRMSDGVPDVAGGGSHCVSGQTLERISLVGFKRQNALGFCELHIPNAGSIATKQWKCCIYRPTGDLFATLEEEPTGVVSSLLATHGTTISGVPSYGTKCYMLTTVATGARFWIQGDMAKRNMVVVSETNKQKPIIYVEPGDTLQFKSEEGEYCRLRCLPKVDCGVVVMALLALDRLPGSPRSSGRK